MQNRLKTISFFIKTGFSFAKTAWKAIRDPDVCASYIRVYERCRPGSSGIPTGGAGMFICHVRDTFMSCFYILSGRKRRFFQIILYLRKLFLKSSIEGRKNETPPIIPTNTPPIIKVLPIPIVSAKNPVLNNPIMEGNILTLI